MSSSHQWKPDLFVSFRGEDTRNHFMSHLFYRLNEAGIGCFRDDRRDDAGEEIEEKLDKAIHEVRFALIVFSANYANSKWCLNELVEILNRRRERKDPKLEVIPIFYVAAREVSKWTSDGNGKLDQALEGLAEEAKADKKAEWTEAIKEAKKITGYGLKKDANEYVPGVLTPSRSLIS